MKIRCKKCGDIIQGDERGTFIVCKCKECYIDETDYYCQVGGDFKNIEAVIDFTEYNDLRIQVSSREEVANKYEAVLKSVREDIVFCINDMKNEYPCTDERTKRELHTMVDILEKTLQTIGKGK